jgi:hypothetical protein
VLGRNKGKERKRNRRVKGHARTSEREREGREGKRNRHARRAGFAGPRVRCYKATVGWMTLLSAARYFPHIFTRVNIVYTTRSWRRPQAGATAPRVGSSRCPGRARRSRTGRNHSTGWYASQGRRAQKGTPRSLRLCSRRREHEGRRAIKTARTSW